MDSKKLSDDLRVRVDKDGEQWTLIDDTRGVSYPIRFIAPLADDQTEEDIDQERTKAYLQVRGSGWRIVEGYEFAILIMTFLFVLYGMAGGLGAAIITDFIQGILTITFSFLLLPFVFQKIGGFGSLHSEGDIRPGMFDLIASPEVAATLGKEPITLFYVIMLSITALTGIVVQPHIMGVCGAGKNRIRRPLRIHLRQLPQTNLHGRLDADGIGVCGVVFGITQPAASFRQTG